jgi:hypothetical protein
LLPLESDFNNGIDSPAPEGAIVTGQEILEVHYCAYPEVQQLLDDLTRNLTIALGDQLIGLYLFGSLTGPDFDMQSDVDVLAVTKNELTEENFSNLSAMHNRLAALPIWCANQLEISYIPLDAVRMHNPANSVHPHLDRGLGKHLEMVQHHEDWIVQRYVLRQRGITLMGPDPKSLIEPVSIKDLQQASASLLNIWLAGFVEDASPVQTVGYQSYLVLTVCRVLYTLVEGDVVSKRAAVEWAKNALDHCWTPLVERAWRNRRDPNQPVSNTELLELQKFIRYGLSHYSLKKDETGEARY